MTRDYGKRWSIQTGPRILASGDLVRCHLTSNVAFHLNPIQGVQALANLDNPGDWATAAEWANRLAMGAKTFHRRFLQSTGMTFGKWRQQLRLMASLALLMQGMPITQVALASGYDSHSAYSTAFSNQFGRPPSAFAANR